MKKIGFLLSCTLLFCVMAVPAFAVTKEEVRNAFTAKGMTTELKNFNSGFYFVSKDYGIVYTSSVDLTGYNNVNFRNADSPLLPSWYSHDTLITTSLTRYYNGSASQGTYSPSLSNGVYYSSPLMSVTTFNGTSYTQVGAPEVFFQLTPTGAENLTGVQGEAIGRLIAHFGTTSQTVLIVALGLFSTLLVVPLIPRLIRYFLH